MLSLHCNHMLRDFDVLGSNGQAKGFANADTAANFL